MLTCEFLLHITVVYVSMFRKTSVHVKYFTKNGNKPIIVNNNMRKFHKRSVKEEREKLYIGYIYILVIKYI